MDGKAASPGRKMACYYLTLMVHVELLARCEVPPSLLGEPETKAVPSPLGASTAFLVRMTTHRRLAGLPSELEKIVGKAQVIQEGEFFDAHRKDMADYEGTPAVVVRPQSEEQVSAIVQLANRREVPILAWGAGSSLTGAVVRDGAIVVDMRRSEE